MLHDARVVPAPLVDISGNLAAGMALWQPTWHALHIPSRCQRSPWRRLQPLVGQVVVHDGVDVHLQGGGQGRVKPCGSAERCSLLAPQTLWAAHYHTEQHHAGMQQLPGNFMAALWQHHGNIMATLCQLCKNAVAIRSHSCCPTHLRLEEVGQKLHAAPGLAEARPQGGHLVTLHWRSQLQPSQHVLAGALRSSTAHHLRVATPAACRAHTPGLLSDDVTCKLVQQVGGLCCVI